MKTTSVFGYSKCLCAKVLLFREMTKLLMTFSEKRTKGNCTGNARKRVLNERNLNNLNNSIQKLE